MKTLENTSRHSWGIKPIPAMQASDWLSLAAVLALAIVLRLLFYTGFFGSDEVTYVGTAVNIASGDWRASNYIGATRYGMNLPVAFFIYIFGVSEASANLWSFLCSIGEVALVFIIARWFWSTRAAIISAGLLALLPLHVHFAGRMMADPPLAFFLTLSVALLLCAACSKRPVTYIAAGLAWGGVYWVKESVALLYLPVFVFLGVILNRFDGRGLWLFVGIGMAVAANCLLMYFVAGNPMHIFAVMKATVTDYAAGGFDSAMLSTSPWYYLRYLFLDIRHTFLLGFLALAGIVLYTRRFFMRDKQPSFGIRFVILWALLLVGMFSFAVVSFSPVKLVFKQSNYMLIFSAPLALLAGWFLASLSKQVFIPLGALIVFGSVVLSALEQQAITVFTANSRAAYVFLRDHANTFLVGTTNNQRAVEFYSMIEKKPELSDYFIQFGEMEKLEISTSQKKLTKKLNEENTFAVLDLQNIEWGNNLSSIRSLSDVPKCWIPMGTIAPATLGNGRMISQGIMAVGVFLPEGLRQRYVSILKSVTLPLPAYIFRIPNSNFKCKFD